MQERADDIQRSGKRRELCADRERGSFTIDIGIERFTRLKRDRERSTFVVVE
jgi:hypothetical protein